MSAGGGGESTALPSSSTLTSIEPLVKSLPSGRSSEPAFASGHRLRRYFFRSFPSADEGYKKAFYVVWRVFVVGVTIFLKKVFFVVDLKHAQILVV